MNSAVQAFKFAGVNVEKQDFHATHQLGQVCSTFGPRARTQLMKL